MLTQAPAYLRDQRTGSPIELYKGVGFHELYYDQTPEDPIVTVTLFRATSSNGYVLLIEPGELDLPITTDHIKHISHIKHINQYGWDRHIMSDTNFFNISRLNYNVRVPRPHIFGNSLGQAVLRLPGSKRLNSVRSENRYNWIRGIEVMRVIFPLFAKQLEAYQGSEDSAFALMQGVTLAESAGPIGEQIANLRTRIAQNLEGISVDEEMPKIILQYLEWSKQYVDLVGEAEARANVGWSALRL